MEQTQLECEADAELALIEIDEDVIRHGQYVEKPTLESGKDSALLSLTLNEDSQVEVSQFTNYNEVLRAQVDRLWN